ncbi:MAG: short chain dehydrogenase [marine bacterium B5-7]|nr:MAG: short chain dehydrogenase [marine bacterium B5-7]
MPHSKKMSKGTALITGGAVRLGKVFCATLANAGYKLAIHYNSSSEQAAATAKEFRETGVHCETFQFDFSAKNNVSDLITKVRKQFPDLNVLINSASVYDQATMMETPERLLERQFKVNFQAPYLLTQAFAQQCKSGNVINIIDNKIAFNQYQYSAYVLSKKSLAEFTRLAAVELAPDVRVNGIAPGVVLPASTRSQDYIDWRVEGIPLKQQGQTDNIAQALQYLLTNNFVCGQILFVDGGESLTNTGQNSANHR